MHNAQSRNNRRRRNALGESNTGSGIGIGRANLKEAHAITAAAVNHNSGLLAGLAVEHDSAKGSNGLGHSGPGIIAADATRGLPDVDLVGSRASHFVASGEVEFELAGAASVSGDGVEFDEFDALVRGHAEVGEGLGGVLQWSELGHASWVAGFAGPGSNGLGRGGERAGCADEGGSEVDDAGVGRHFGCCVWKVDGWMEDELVV